MPIILDHVSPTPVLEIDVWPRSATRKEWFAITRRIIQDTIADMNLDPAAEAEVIEAFTGAGLLWMIRSWQTNGRVAAAEALHMNQSLKRNAL